MRRIILNLILLFFSFSSYSLASDWLLPVQADSRRTWKSVKLTSIGFFGLKRKARPGIPAHLHTGVDIKRPRPNYENEPIFPAFSGEVISLRDDGPFAQIIIVHKLSDNETVWTVYEHISGITVKLGDMVDPEIPMARFMTRSELNKYGWQFNHLHFEILRSKPRSLKANSKTPFRFYNTYSLICYSSHDLRRYYYNPIDFLDAKWKK